MSGRLRRILTPTVEMAVTIGLIFVASLLVRMLRGVPLFDGPGLFFLVAVPTTILLTAVLAEIVPSRYRGKAFMLGVTVPIVFFGCAMVAYWLRTGDAPTLDVFSLQISVVITLASGMIGHYCGRHLKRSPSNNSLDGARGG